MSSGGVSDASPIDYPVFWVGGNLSRSELLQFGLSERQRRKSEPRGFRPTIKELRRKVLSVFTRIINRELPAKIFYETDDVIVIADHRPQRPVHLLLITKAEYPDFQRTPPEALALLCETAKVVAEKLGIPDHYQLAINNGLGQEVDHIHFHFFSDRGMERLEYAEG